MLKLLGTLDIAAGFLAILGLPAVAGYYLLVKALIFLFLAPTCILNWMDLISAVFLIFFYSFAIAIAVFAYLLVKGSLSFL